MSVNVLITEWDDVVKEAAILLRALLPTAQVVEKSHGVSANVGLMSIHIGLIGALNPPGSLTPRVHVGSATALLGDIGDVLGGLEEQRALILAALRVPVVLGSRMRWPDHIWSTRCPCDHCSATGGRRGDCRKCSGTGYRETA
jgi:hypothetical protein